jgi:translocation and assembly module TamA
VSGAPELLSSRHLASLATFDSGDIYRESEIQDLRQMILATGLASRVSMTPREAAPPDGEEPGTVDVDIGIDPAPLRTIKAGIGYGTGEGFTISGSWEHRNLFPPEGMLMVRGLLGTREMLAGVTYQRSNLGGGHRVLTVDTSVNQEDRDSYNARTATLLANYELKSTPLHHYRFTWGLGTELLVTDEREIQRAGVLTERQTYLVGAFPLHALLDTSDNLLDPRSGFRLGLKFSPEVSLKGTDATTYLRARWDGSGYRQVGGGTVVAARAALGSILGAETDAIAPSRRFYAGGGGSIRGYGFEEVGVGDNSVDAIGGRSIAEFSLEARIPTGIFRGALSVVPFVDGGAVYPEKYPTFDNFRFGAGLGFRYSTPIGPFRVDIATPLNPRPQDSKIVFYISLGQAF